MPFSMLPLRPEIAAFRRVFSFSVMPSRGFWAFSTPLGYGMISKIFRCLQYGGGNAYAKLNGNREEIHTSSLSNLFTARYAGQVDVTRLDETLLASDSLQYLLGETIEDALVSRDRRKGVSCMAIYRKPA